MKGSVEMKRILKEANLAKNNFTNYEEVTTQDIRNYYEYTLNDSPSDKWIEHNVVCVNGVNDIAPSKITDINTNFKYMVGEYYLMHPEVKYASIDKVTLFAIDDIIDQYKEYIDQSNLSDVLDYTISDFIVDKYEIEDFANVMIFKIDGIPFVGRYYS